MKPQDQSRSQTLQQLSRMIEAVEDFRGADSHAVPTGWCEIDRALGDKGLRRDVVHEFLGPLAAETLGEGGSSPPPGGRGQADIRPACLLSWLAGRAATVAEGAVVWVGRQCWPNPQTLARAELLDRSLFVRAVKGADRLWAIELALRCVAVAAVVGDAEGFSLPATRRLELAASRQGEALVLLSRPGRERLLSSAAATRWAIYRRLGEGDRPAWTLELLRCKGRQVSLGRWPMEWDCAKGAVIISAPLVDRLPSTSRQARQRHIG